MTPLWPQLKDATQAARLMAQTGAVRKALGHMLDDPAYPEALKSRPWVEKWLATAAWSDQLREGLTILALRYYGHRDDAIAKILRAALGRNEVSPREEKVLQGMLSSAGKGAVMTTIADAESFDNGSTGMVDLYGDPEALKALHRHATEMDVPPFNTPPDKLAKALVCVERGRVEWRKDWLEYSVVGSKGTPYTVGSEGCSCPHGTKTHKTKYNCYHAVAAELYRRWQGLPAMNALLAKLANENELGDTFILTEGEDQGKDENAPESILEPSRGIEEETVSTTVDEPTHGSVPPLRREPLTISAKYVTAIHGRPHVQFQGLVLAAQEAGLVSLAVEWTYNDAELSLAHAVAKFADGRSYEESGDATPGNVRPGIKEHFRRMALTRASARCLRNALGIGEAAIEELSDEIPVSGARDEIKQLLARLGFHPQTAGDARRIIAKLTQLDMAEANYPAIIRALKELL